MTVINVSLNTTTITRIPASQWRVLFFLFYLGQALKSLTGEVRGTRVEITFGPETML